MHCSIEWAPMPCDIDALQHRVHAGIIFQEPQHGFRRDFLDTNERIAQIDEREVLERNAIDTRTRGVADALQTFQPP